jgi:hypothetical protein
MFTCPHCGKAIEAGPPAEVPWWKYDPGGRRVSLGCGTLILIAVIVAMFSRVGDESDAIRDLQKDIQTLEKKIDSIQVKGAAAPAIRGEHNQ